jgi:DNA-binding response OmpR family regulator
MVKILIADDEVKYIELLREILIDEGFDVLAACDGEKAYDLFNENQDISLIILDKMMPKLNGFEVCEKIREKSNIPILILTALSDSENEIKGLNCGANDYVKKPFRIDILVARIKNLLKDELTASVTIDDIVLIKKSMCVYKNNIIVELSPKEYSLLIYIINNKNIVLSRSQILDAVWGNDFFGDQRTVDTHIKALRKKFPKFGLRIKTIRGTGYLLQVKKDEIN